MGRLIRFPAPKRPYKPNGFLAWGEELPPNVVDLNSQRRGRNGVLDPPPFPTTIFVRMLMADMKRERRDRMERVLKENCERDPDSESLRHAMTWMNLIRWARN